MRIIKVALCFFLLTFPLLAFTDQKVEINYPDTPIIYNLTLTLADTEYSQALPAGTTKVMYQCRTGYAVKVAYTATESGTTYWTIKPDHFLWDDHISATRQTIYVQSEQAGTILEIFCWTQ